MLDEAMMDRIPFLRNAGPAARREVARRGVARRFDTGQVLWSAGAVPRGLFVIVEGAVRVVGARDGRQHVVHAEGAGATLGEVPLFAGGRYPATAIAAVPTTCAVLDRDAVYAAITADPEVAFELLGGLARRVRGLVERLDAVRGESVRQRLARALLARHQVAGGGEFALGCSQAALAEELGTVREVLVRALGELRRSGAVRSVRRGIFAVADPSALAQIADAG